MHGQAGRSRCASATAPRPCGRRGRGSRAARRTARSTSVGARGSSGCRTTGRTGRLPPGVTTSTQAWPSQVIVVSRPIAIAASSAGAALATPVTALRRAAPTRRGYTRPVAAQQIADEPRADQLDRAVAAGGRLVRGRRVRRGSRRRRPRGILAFTAACAVGFGVLAYLSDTGAARGRSPAPRCRSTRRSTCRAASRCVFVVARRRDTLALARGRRATIPGDRRARRGAGGHPAGRAHAGAAARSGVVSLAVQLGVLAAATGGVFAAMILGHWYLVTPSCRRRPSCWCRGGCSGSSRSSSSCSWPGSGSGPGPGRPAGPFGALVGPVGAVRVAAADRRPRVPARRVVGRDPDRAHAVDGVRDGPPVHQRRRRSPRGRSSPRGSTSGRGCSSEAPVTAGP